MILKVNIHIFSYFISFFFFFFWTADFITKLSKKLKLTKKQLHYNSHRAFKPTTQSSFLLALELHQIYEWEKMRSNSEAFDMDSEEKNKLLR